MHEMSIAGAVLDAVGRHAGDRRVTRVQLRIGHLRQVVPSALQFAWSLITRDTPAEDAALAIEAVATEGACRSCGAHGAQPCFPLRCGACGSLDVEIVAGEELEIDWIEVADEVTAPGGRSA